MKTALIMFASVFVFMTIGYALGNEMAGFVVGLVVGLVVLKRSQKTD